MSNKKLPMVYKAVPVVETSEIIFSLDEVPYKQAQQAHVPNWQPCSFRWHFFAIPLFLHVIQLISTSLLLGAWYSKSDLLGIDLRNTASYLLWQFVPLVTVVSAGFFWETIYLDICQLEPFYQLTHPGGVTLKDSLSLDYSTSFTWFVPFRAFNRRPHRHIAVVLASLTYILVATILPTTAIAMLKMRLLSATDAEVIVFPAFAALNIIVLTASIACGTALYFLLRRRRTGIYSAPASIGGISSLVSGSDLLEAFRKLHSYDSQRQIDEVLGHCRLSLGYKSAHDTGNSYQIRLLDPVDSLTIPSQAPTKRTRAEAHSWWLWGRIEVVFYVFLLALAVLLQVIPSIEAYSLRILTTVTNIITAAVWSNWHRNIAMLEPYYRLSTGKTIKDKVSEVYNQTYRIDSRKRRVLKGTSNALYLDFTSSAVSTLSTGMRKETRATFVSLVAFCTLTVQLSIITNPAFINLRNIVTAILTASAEYGAASSSLTAGRSPVPRGMLICWFVLLGCLLFAFVASFIGLVAVLLRKRKPIMPRKPYTYSSMILYLCNSVGLLEDMAGTSTMSKKARDDHLRQKSGKYGLGWIQGGDDGRCRVGIERMERIKEGFIFGEVLPGQAS